MDRKQITRASSLFFERDRMQRILDTVISGSGLAVQISGDYQKEGVLDCVRPTLQAHFEELIAAIDAELKQAGWSGE